VHLQRILVVSHYRPFRLISQLELNCAAAMGLSLWHLFKASLLMINSVMILNRKRFLSKYGLDDLNNMQAHGGNNPLKAQFVGLLHAVQYLKVPVIIANIFTIIFEILLGG